MINIFETLYSFYSEFICKHVTLFYKLVNNIKTVCPIIIICHIYNVCVTFLFVHKYFVKIHSYLFAHENLLCCNVNYHIL